MTKVKICGITNFEDAKLAADLGADLLGFNFYEKSKRYIEPNDAKAIIKSLDAALEIVGIFVDEEIETILQIGDLCGLNAVQLHGNETPEFVAELERRTDAKIIKVFRIGPNFDTENIKLFPAFDVLLDSAHGVELGGTGHTFDWEIASQINESVERLYLAGGLTPENVADAINQVRPYAVDVCSKIESVPGKKDPIKLERFIKEVKENDQF